MNATEYAKTDDFIKKCESASIRPTKRQAAKFLRGAGYLYKTQILKLKDIHLPKEARSE